MATFSSKLIPLQIFNVTVATGVDSVYSWGAATVSVPPVPTTYTVEGLRIVEVNPTELIIGGATQSTSVDQTIYAGGPAITLPSGKDWAPQTVSFGDLLYLGPRLSTDTYPPHALTSITNTATALSSQATNSTVIFAFSTTSVATNPTVTELETAAPPTMTTLVESLSPSSTATFSLLPTPSGSRSVSNPSSTGSEPSLITFISIGPPLVISSTSNSLSMSASGFANSTGYSMPTANITTFTGGATASEISGWSIALGVGLILSTCIKRLWH